MSEKLGRSASPRVFWWLSLCASLLLASTTFGLQEWVLLPGYMINGMIYARNIFLGESKDQPTKSRLGPIPAALIGLALAALLVGWGVTQSDAKGNLGLAWLIVGVTGQTIWSARFILQWWLSERAGYSHFPLSFWWLSLAGSLLNLAYTLQLATPVFWIGFITAWFVPLRNLMLEYRHRRNLSPSLSAKEL
ncbi:MAG: lipid-A-disaccharide synthase-like uncharacterized protein [Planctomycetota bacterium]|jgi:lipid-A-disaccharide synthase-like uncharacterized protein